MNTLNSSTSLITKSNGPVKFPTMKSTIPNFGNSVYVDLDGSNMVMSAQGGVPAGDPYTYLYWSDDYGATLNIATIDGTITKFFGCVAISGANAIAMGRLTSAGTTSIYLSSDYGKTYVTGVSNFGYGSGRITMSGANAAFVGYQAPVYVSNNYGATWTWRGNARNNVDIKMYGNNIYLCAIGNPSNTGGSLYYSTNLGVSFTRSTTQFSANCVTLCGSNLYVGSGNVIYNSTNNGQTFTAIYSSALIRTPCGITSYPGTNGDFIWFGNNDTSANYYSNDGGATWTATSGVAKPFTCVVAENASEKIMAAGSDSSGGFYWGRNKYIL